MKYVGDSLRTIIGGLGEIDRDKRAGVYYDVPWLDDGQLLNMYRGSWLPRKIVNIPARDSVRAWRSWQGADEAQVELIEAEENRLMYRQKIELAQVRARLFGGAAIYISTGETDLMKPFEPEKVGKGGIKYLTVMSRARLPAGEIENDPLSEFFERPKYYTINETQIHPSRFIRFTGADHPEPFYSFGIQNGWGDSVLLPLIEAIKNLDATAANVASLVFEANVDVFGIPDFLEKVSDVGYQKRFADRMALVVANKGINRSLLKDAEETYERKNITFATLPEVIQIFMQLASGACDIPATRLLGMSPSGMSATGESDLRNYYDAVSADQQLIMTPTMYRADEALLRSALGARPAEIHYIWTPLWQMTTKERAEVGKIIADTTEVIGRTGLISQEALGTGLVNSLVEHSIYPGLEDAVEETPVDYDALLEHEEALREKELEPPPVNPAFAKDAAPRSLYISRAVKNSLAIVKWAKSQGFSGIEDELHVTVCYSHTPVDWFKVGESWSSELKVAAGGPRMIERFGAAVVLHFACRELDWRHQQIIDLGGSHAFAEYSPHVTITWGGDDVDLEAVEPYQGEIVLGPEIFETVKV